ncbi:hypothetical protein DPX16_3306 [Anabarilius grahami]|uniref:Uncharacterized protein n=1 Tax=Anabarilius grahami TaxID=495550 RepID=A0A3N0XL91_ANAGA|nr:hypothetical protein DPX16_3306 [Anabarilius grahami]
MTQTGQDHRDTLPRGARGHAETSAQMDRDALRQGDADAGGHAETSAQVDRDTLQQGDAGAGGHAETSAQMDRDAVRQGDAGAGGHAETRAQMDRDAQLLGSRSYSPDSTTTVNPPAQPLLTTRKLILSICQIGSGIYVFFSSEFGWGQLGSMYQIGLVLWEIIDGNLPEACEPSTDITKHLKRGRRSPETVTKPLIKLTFEQLLEQLVEDHRFSRVQLKISTSTSLTH